MGIGNLLCADDGVGVHAVRELTRKCHPARQAVAQRRRLKRSPGSEGERAESKDLVSFDYAGGDCPSRDSSTPLSVARNDKTVTFVDAGTAILHALPFAEEATHLLVIDAVKAGREPGSVYEFDGYEMASAADVQSLHSLGLKQALEFVEPDRRPETFTVLGVEPALVEYGTELSRPVRAALPDVVARADRVVSDWTTGGDGK